jgi:hypothetical protein
MIRRKTGFKECAVLGVISASLIAVACSDDEDAIGGAAGSSGKAGGSSTAGKPNGGSSTAGSSTAGSSNGGTPGTGGTSAGSAGTSAGTGTAGTQNVAGDGGDSAGAAGGGGVGEGGAGEGGEPGMPQAGEGGAAGGGGAPGAGGEGGEPFVPDVLDNPGFEVGTPHAEIPGWTNEGTANAAYIEYATPHSGFGKLGHWTQWVDQNSPPYTARTYQTVSPIANGTYSFSLWVKRDWFDVQYLFATGFNAADMNAEVSEETDDAEAAGDYVKITLSGIEVTSGACTVGIYSAAPAGTFANFDDAELSLE